MLQSRPGSDATAATDLSYVKVADIPGRTGQLVRNELIVQLGIAQVSVSPVYRLEVELEESREGLAFQRDDSVTRYNYRLYGTFRLIDVRTGAVATHGKTRVIAAYNVVRSDYANLIAERDARDRAARDLAQEIRLRLGVYFSRQRT